MICCLGTYVACVWAEPKDVNPVFPQGEPLASKIRKDCIQAHEDGHIKQPGNEKCGDCDFFRVYGDQKNHDLHECEMYRAEHQCLIDNFGKCGANADCKRAIRLAAKHLRDVGTQYCRAAGKGPIFVPPGSFP